MTHKNRRLLKRLSGPWSFKQGLVVLLSFIAIFIFLSWAHIFWIKSTVGFDAYLGDGPRLPPHLLITNQLIKAATLLGVIWLVAIRGFNLNWKSVGLKTFHPKWALIAVLFAVIGASASLILAKLMIAFIPEWSGFSASRYAWGDGSVFQMLTLMILTILLTPIAEEIFFRGFLFQWMATYRPIWLAVFISSIMFGVSHIIPPQVIVAIFMSFFILYLYLKSGSVWPCIICHVTNNALGMILGMMSVASQLPTWLTPPG
jgi:membrane protease YdiL (CAAX protease family)